MNGERNLLSPREIEQHALELAQQHVIGKKARFPRALLAGVKRHYQTILEVYQTLDRELDREQPLPPTAEWLLDNFYLLEEQVKDIQHTLTRKPHLRLPLLENKEMAGLPRVYGLARELVEHTDGNLDEGKILSFIGAYQQRQVLAMTELWALAVMLRIALLERISQLCQELKVCHRQRQRAWQVATQLQAGELRRLVREQREAGGLEPAFLELLVQQLRRQGGKAAPLLAELEQELAASQLSLEELIREEHGRQAARQVAMGAAITSLRSVAALDWNEIFEALSQVEAMLRQDPSGHYSRMDFASRDYYRHEIEKLARYYQLPERLVAEQVLTLARAAAERGKGEAARHAGYYLLGEGRGELEDKLGGRPRGLGGLRSWLRQHPYRVYFGSLVFLTLAVIGLLMGYVSRAQGGWSWRLLALLPLVALPASEIALILVNFCVSRLYAPRPLPRLELREGIGPENSTMVIIPTLLPKASKVQELVEKLEVHYLANREENLYFALVGDFKDGPEPEAADDAEIVAAALAGIAELNQRYAQERPRFFYFHRKRRYNPAQGQWLGWERKRGAIIELNDLLLGARDTSFTVISCAREQLPRVKYIITLDADTSLPLGTARQLIGTMAHPLNQPVVDREQGLVVRGHGILQPRIGVQLESANRTWFSRIFAGQGGIDPYTTAVSDVYQDLFGEGIFTGKGIYELETFQILLKEAIPENAVLSHDLLEGSYLRAGLVTDIELLDGYPARYLAYSLRQHRWVRGDWQLLPWLKSRVKDRQGQWRPNPLSPLSKWKICDNLRRSLVSPALVLLVVLGTGLLPGSSLVWLGLGLGTVALPTLLYLLSEGVQGRTVLTGVRASVYQSLLQFLFLPYQGYLMLDAIIRTLVRVLVTGKNLLEWIPAAELETLLKNDLATYYRKLFMAPLAGVLVAVLAWGRGESPATTGLGLLVGLTWLLAPAVAWWVSRDYMRAPERLTAAEEAELRRLARQTWAYFEDMVIAQDHYLPPDNYQVDPPKGVAHRTSPTNIGLLLVSTLAARDLGFLGTGQMLERIQATLATVEKLEKWEGHLYNWYDTLTLRVLRPRYVSTVDSGNFVGYLLVLAEGIREYLKRPGLEPVLLRGLLDTIALHNEEAGTAGAITTGELESLLARAESSQAEWLVLLEQLEEQLQGRTSSYWGQKVLAMVQALRAEMACNQEELRSRGEDLLQRIQNLVENTRFAPLYDSRRKLFSIGYHVDEGQLTKSYYDLLASEARLASYLAIARGEVEARHWFRLGRKLTRVEGDKGLVSWAGTMFEYLMPLLVMRTYENTLLDATYSFAVRVQQKYGQERGVPWGISEAAYYAFDLALNYQYKAFGVPDLGLKRGLAQELVVAPYATILALPLVPRAALTNLRRLREEGLAGIYGFYEAIDYTLGQKAVVKNYMAHHLGMSLLALTNFFTGNSMQQRFHANPAVKAAEILLQERIPLKVSIIKEQREAFRPRQRKFQDEPEVVRKYGVPEREMPRVHLLSNGSYSLLLTDGGAGYSKWQDLALTRWQENWPGFCSGFYIYIQNLNANNVWSATFEPYRVEPEYYQVIFAPDKAEYLRKDGNIETHTRITVSPEDNAEIRTVTLTNHSQYERVVEVTSYLEVVLAPPEADTAHPAFSKLFVTTEFVPGYDCLLAVRRPRSQGQKPLYALHSISVKGEVAGDLQYETDRAKFIGRNRNLDYPLALAVDQPLSNSSGAVLDPIFSLRRRVRLKPGQSAQVAFVLAVAETRAEALRLADKYRDEKAIARAFELAWNRSRLEADYLDLPAREVETYLKLIPALLFPGPARRQYAELIAGNRKGQPDLWPFGISGDLPIVLVRIADQEEVELVQRLLRAHDFWRRKGLAVDLVLLVEEEEGYTRPLQDRIRELILVSPARELFQRKGGVYLLVERQLTEADRTLLFTVARLCFTAATSWEELAANPRYRPALPELVPEAAEEEEETVPLEPGSLLFYNGLGGFSPDGREYVIWLKEGQTTPAPWLNVLANPGFGCNITEAGAGYTWAENSRENKLTPWSNDPVSDPPGEVIYLRDESNGRYWSLTPQPIREKRDYLIRHGQGYTVFQQQGHGLGQELTVFVAGQDPVKICLVKLHNYSSRPRRLTLTYYLRPVMGVDSKSTAPYLVSRSYGEKGILLFTNTYNHDFPGRLLFVDCSESRRSWTADGLEFIGANGTLEFPAAMKRTGLSGRVGAGLVPAGVMQTTLELAPGETREVVFLLGQARSEAEVETLCARYSRVEEARAELARVKAFWQERLGALLVKTPDQALDLLLNGWLLYQVIACRLWSRAAFYQSGGAYGFRDQLQDVMAVAYTWPELTRKQIMLHAAHQFLEGDVQHWWHPGAEKGIRTRYSDDLLWLPYVTADYIRVTGDWSILAEEAGYLEDEPLDAGEDERYSIPRQSQHRESLYQHCLRAIDHALKFGPHGLPLMGCGDWNDGMNKVGHRGQGESVWLAWFLCTVLERFIPICRAQGDLERAEKFADLRQQLAEAIEKHAWDGSWYRRAYFDDGTPLGSAENSECKIDAIAQSWSVISGLGRPRRAEEAMLAVENYLVDREAGIIKLLTPPFGDGELEPGYIKGYVPGVRENGGQYTHAAVWTALAFALLGQGDKAGELLSLLNPINHARTSIEAMRYKVEPYVLAADVYAVAPNTGRGGWTWYTGAAGWFYRVAIEHILGLKKEGNRLRFNPCIPRDWAEYQVQYRFGSTLYLIQVRNPERMNRGVKRVVVDGREKQDGAVELVDDGEQHRVEVIIG